LSLDADANDGGSTDTAQDSVRRLATQEKCRSGRG